MKSVRSLIIGCLVTLFFCCLTSAGDKAFASQSEKDRTAQLIEGAKKEGKLVLYTTTAPEPLIKKIQAKYPFLHLEIYRAGEENIMIKMLTEERAKRYAVDVAGLTLITAEVLKRKGLFAKYLSPERDAFTDVSKDPEGYWTDSFLNINTIGYNTKLVSAREVPRTWEDLLDPKWKGRMGMDTKAYWWFSNMLKVMGRKKGQDYMKRLGEQNILFRNGRTLNAQMVAAGEVGLGITIYNYMIEELKSKGAPVEWVPLDPVIPELHPLAISAHAPHPNAARLCVDFILSREGQEAMASTFRIPSRTDVDARAPKLKKGLKILPPDLGVISDYDKDIKLYRELLMRR